MPRASAAGASQVLALPGWEGRYEPWDVDGGITVGFETYEADIDWTEPMKALPDGCCVAPHTGYCLEGKVGFVFDGKEEVYVAGEAFYVPPGHTTKTYAGSKAVYFTPTKEFQELMDAFAQILGSA